MDTSGTILLVMVFFFASLFCWQYLVKSSTKKLPPGPPRFPIIGSLLSVLWADAKDPSKAFLKLSKKYGPIVSLQMGAVPVVAISGHDIISRIANCEELLSRVNENDTWLLEKTNSLPLGFVFALRQFSADTRAFTHKLLKKYDFDYGTGKASNFIMEEIVDLCDEFKGHLTNGQGTIAIRRQFGHLYFNILWRFMAGAKYGNSETTRIMVEILDQFATSGFNELKKNGNTWRNSIKEVIAEARADGGYLSNPKNFLEDFLQKVDTTPKPTNVLDSIYTEDNLVAVVQDMTLGGTDSQSNVMKFLIRYLIQYPEFQQQCYLEIQTVIGNSRLVCADDIPNLKYVEALVAEVIRIVGLAPITPRKLLQDWKFDGYRIPKGTLVVLNIWSADNDENVHKNPEMFQPSRFLPSENGPGYNADRLLSFGIGKRRCIGEHLTKTCLVLTVATLIQNFSFQIDPNFGIKYEDTFGLARDTVPYNVLVKCREYFE